MRTVFTIICKVIFCVFVFVPGIVFCQCNNWLNVEAIKSGVQIGDLGIAGNQLTVEAEFDRTAVYDIDFHGGELVSKHRGTVDANYLLRPNLAGITTTNGFFDVLAGCLIDTGKTYHAALVYDGDSLKLYRNGYLMGAVAATGDLIQNDYLTTIGTTAYQPTPGPSDFIGYINEVRIWNVARSQADIRQFMDSSLPAPAKQTGLMAYYTFNNLLNKQGNAAWNGNIIGTADTVTTNPTCASFIADSCGAVLPVLLTGFYGTIINSTVKLTWTTAQEINTDYFEVQRAADNHNFKTIATLPAAGNNSGQISYSAIDKSPVGGDNFYRLKITGKDGKITYSQVNRLVFTAKGELSIYPNPTTQFLNISSRFAGETLTIKVTDGTGKQVMLLKKANQPNLQIATGNLAPGMYMVSVSDGIQELKKKIVKAR